MTALHRLFALLTTLVITLAFAILPARAEPGDIDAAARGVVRVVIVSGAEGEILPVSHGSGFAIDAQTIVTNAHVVAEALDDPDLQIGIVPSNGNGGAVYGRVLSISPRNDLALVRTSRPLRVAPLALAGLAPVNGTGVVAIGYPMNVDQAQGLAADDIFRAQPPVTSRGFLSGRRPSRDFDTLLHTAPIARGNSGGPLVDECGRVVGVNSFGAESDATEAEFFFAVTVRELLPFLRANQITPQTSSLPCRSLDELDAEERARAELAARNAQAEAQANEEAEARRSDRLRREIEFAVLDERATGMALAMFALIVAMASSAYAAQAHARGDQRRLKIGGAVAGAALIAAVAAIVTRPGYAVVEERLEQKLHEDMADDPAVAPQAASTSGTYACVLDTGRTRAVSAPAATVPVEWTEDGCVNGRTQYGESSGEWSRVLVPNDEDTVSVTRFDPSRQEYVVERYLLDADQMEPLREARGKFEAPSCGTGRQAAATLGSSQQALRAMLPDRPNERLVYDCSGRIQPPAPVDSATPEG
jgi:serine protease Do